MVDQVNNNTEIKKPVEQAKTEKKDELNVEKFTKSVWSSGASASYGCGSYQMFNNIGAGGIGNMFNPSFGMNGAFQEKVLPGAVSLFSMTQFFAPNAFTGTLQNWWNIWNQTNPSKQVETSAEDKTKKPGDATGNKPQTDAEKFTALKEEAKTYKVTVEDKDTYDTLKVKVDAAKAKAGEKPAGKTGTEETGGAGHTGHKGHKGHKAVEINPNDIDTEGGGHNHLYTDDKGNRICKRYNKDGILRDTLTYKDGKLIGNVKAEKKEEKAEVAKKEEISILEKRFKNDKANGYTDGNEEVLEKLKSGEISLKDATRYEKALRNLGIKTKGYLEEKNLTSYFGAGNDADVVNEINKHFNENHKRYIQAVDEKDTATAEKQLKLLEKYSTYDFASNTTLSPVTTFSRRVGSLWTKPPWSESEQVLYAGDHMVKFPKLDK